MPAVPCSTGVGSPLLVNVTQQISNDPDSGNFGGDWALDNFTRHIQIWQEGSVYCGEADDSGTFTTFGGANGKSPNSGDALPEVVTGTMTGSTHGVLTGTLGDAGNWGDTGTAPAQNCNSIDCSMTSLWVSNYFPGGSYDYSDAPGGWGWTYNGGANGTWVNASTGSSGDILHVAASTVYVDGTNGNDSNDGSQAHPFKTIGAAVNAVASGGTVNIAAGTYQEQVIITKPLTLDGAGNTTIIESPATLTASFSTDSAINGSASPIKAVVSDIGSKVTVENLEINGNGQGNANYSFAGLAVENASPTISNVTISGVSDTPLDGDQDGNALYVYNQDSTTRTAVVTSSTFNGFQKNAMVLAGSGLSANVTGNTITSTPTTQIAQNGVELDDNATATISGNTISGFECNDSAAPCGGDWYNDSQSAAILLYNAAGPVIVSDNTISDSDMGIYSQLTTGTTTASNNILTGNRYFGIAVETGNLVVNGGSITGSAYGFFNPSEHSTGTVSINNVNLTGNTTAAVDNDAASYSFDATQNYWGSTTTPIVGTDIKGAGDANVASSPWFTDAAMTTYGSKDTTNESGDQTTTLPVAFTSTATSTSGNVSINIPGGTTITASSSWDGTFNSPTIVTAPNVTLPSVTVNPIVAIEVGSDTNSLQLSNAARLEFSGQAGKLVGWTVNGSTFTPITTTCTADTQAAGNALAAGGDCVMNSGSDLIVWTKHFTTFVTYTQTPIAAQISTGGGGDSGGGSECPAGTAYSFTTFACVSTSTGVSTSSTGAGQVLGASVYNFTTYLTFGSTGEDTTQLQTILIADGYLNIAAPTGWFGPLTKAAVIKYQIARGIPGTGYVGPLTLAALNAGTTPTTADESASLQANLKAQIAALEAELAQMEASTTTH